MSKHESVIAPFADNWAYLKTELNWLDRLLMLAVARQRQDAKVVNQVAKTAADKATSHWWKGIITLNQAAYDDCRPPTKPASKGPSYAQQLESRIQASQSQGIMLGLPWLQEQFRLSAFEKKLILLVLAPEVNRRFGKLYRYLQHSDDYITEDLPTVDLCLRLLCRNDQEWRQARSQLVAANSLFEWGLLKWVDPPTMTLLSRRLRLADEVTAYLLAEQPDPGCIRHLTPAAQTLEAATPTLAHQEWPELPWNHLALPDRLLEQLEILAASIKHQTGPQLLLLSGESGIGKTTTARALASRWQLPLTHLDLATLTADTAAAALQELTASTGVVLLQTAQRWFGRNSIVETAQVQAWLQRCQAPLICLSTAYLQSITPSWRRTCAAVLTLPRPGVEARRQILRQAVPADLAVDKRLRWIQLARQLPLTGGELTGLVETAIALAQQAPQPVLSLEHFQQALALRHPGLSLRAQAPRSGRP